MGGNRLEFHIDLLLGLLLFNIFLCKLFLSQKINFTTCADDKTQSAFTCSKLTIETLGQGVKYVQN